MNPAIITEKTVESTIYTINYHYHPKLHNSLNRCDTVPQQATHDFRTDFAMQCNVHRVYRTTPVLIR